MSTFHRYYSKREALVWLCMGFIAFDVLASSAAFVTIKPSQRNPHRGLSHLGVSTDHVVHGQHSKDKLNSLTVKELRTILKDSGLNQRGVMSRLKLKQDLVSFLHENLKSPDTEISLSSESLADSASAEIPPTKTSFPFHDATSSPRQPHTMPAPADAQDKRPSSPKDALFQKLYLQYPQLEENDCTGIGENDIRQTYHPVFRNANKTSSDMDIVFVGTASCTPGVTRGVSCTALRLNWKRRALQGAPEGTQTVATNDFAGGTWLFDCGECTQVSSNHRVSCFQS
jgi:hypothetical protein